MTDNNLPRPNRRQQIWDMIRTFKTPFNSKDLQLHLEWKKPQIDFQYLNQLVVHGFLEQVKQKPKHWQLSKDNGVEAPRISDSGELLIDGGVNENLWRAMRISKVFTIDELVRLASTSRRTVARSNVVFYVRLLKNAGYIASRGRMPDKKERLTLIRDTEPKPPQVLRIKEIYDPNLHEIMYREVPDCES